MQREVELASLDRLVTLEGEARRQANSAVLYAFRDGEAERKGALYRELVV